MLREIVSLVAVLGIFLLVLSDKMLWWQALVLVGAYVVYVLVCCFYERILRCCLHRATAEPPGGTLNDGLMQHEGGGVRGGGSAIAASLSRSSSLAASTPRSTSTSCLPPTAHRDALGRRGQPAPRRRALAPRLAQRDGARRGHDRGGPDRILLRTGGGLPTCLAAAAAWGRLPRAAPWRGAACGLRGCCTRKPLLLARAQASTSAAALLRSTTRRAPSTIASSRAFGAVADKSKAVPIELRKVERPPPPTTSAASRRRTTRRTGRAEHRADPFPPLGRWSTVVSDVELHLITDKLTCKLRCGADVPDGTMQRWFVSW